MPERPEVAPLPTLLRLMAALRDPMRGCAWDVAQTFSSVAPYTLEEAYEVVDAVARGDMADMREELGDLLLQVVFHARMAEEAGAFGFDDVARTIADKLIRRHPHVFDASGALLPEGGAGPSSIAVEAQWAAIKAAERRAKGAPEGAGIDPLGGVALALPALTRAEKISQRAASYGFDWPDAAEVIGKVREETDEVAQALGQGDPGAVAEEIGDLLFSVANLARHAGVDPEAALRAGTAKFERRFRAMAARLEEAGRPLPDCDLPAMEAAWNVVKRNERGG
ncbi:nucleoside triphosphate pyrophosphohydrolase [Methylobacterium trifolii]|uniref:Nucleoside triphosphate pyrophosphohydrolase n=1 Tax=Methylobacterium trifolii TaxID=1003092 RepID=A0ABQ4U1B0_9HYPH|nr:nucleoside triphosphate pyrophosphohydrolase [Methylobacterium trifolii]GJE60932.1 Nucleoside triphosphate pyrophosphohydrolase [Methylobacterium trifolii]